MSSRLLLPALHQIVSEFAITPYRTLDQLSKEGQHFKLIPQCEICAQYLNPEYLKEVHSCIDTYWRGSFLHRSYMDWRSKCTRYVFCLTSHYRQCASCGGVTLKVDKDYVCLDCKKKFPFNQLAATSSVKAFASTFSGNMSSVGSSRRFI